MWFVGVGDNVITLKAPLTLHLHRPAALFRGLAHAARYGADTGMRMTTRSSVPTVLVM